MAKRKGKLPASRATASTNVGISKERFNSRRSGGFLKARMGAGGSGSGLEFPTRRSGRRRR